MRASGREEEGGRERKKKRRKSERIRSACMRVKTRARVRACKSKMIEEDSAKERGDKRSRAKGGEEEGRDEIGKAVRVFSRGGSPPGLPSRASLASKQRSPRVLPSYFRSPPRLLPPLKTY